MFTGLKISQYVCFYPYFIVFTTSGHGKSNIAVKMTKILAVSLLIQLHPHIISDSAPLRVNEH